MTTKSNFEAINRVHDGRRDEVVGTLSDGRSARSARLRALKDSGAGRYQLRIAIDCESWHD